MEAERLQMVQNFAAEGNVDALFSVLEEDPYVLERIEQIPFVTTPLHTAASEGNVYFAKEILNLKPSFARKRDHLGRSPLHLALEGKHLKEELIPLNSDLEGKYQQLVTWLINHDRELVRFKAKGMVTPLHYAAELDDEFNLADFFYVCPSSIEDLTTKCETAVHVALKKGSSKAFKVLLGLLRHFSKEEILYWEDEEGNNALHTAVSANQPEAVKLLIVCMEVNQKNSKGLTALDIFYDRQGSVDAAVRNILLTARAKTASQLDRSPRRLPKLINLSYDLQKSLVENFSGPLPKPVIILKMLRLDYLSVNKIQMDVRNVLLVGAVLVATATYQAALSPPGGHWQYDGNLQPANSTGVSNTTTNIYRTGPSEERVAYMAPSSAIQLLFLICNSLAFFMSVCLIMILTTDLPFFMLFFSTISLILSFYLAVFQNFFFPKYKVLGILLFPLLAIGGVATYYIPGFLKLRAMQLTRLGRRRNLRLGSFEKLKM